MVERIPAAWARARLRREVDQLQARGWVLRQPGGDDSRRRLVVLTAEGRKAADDIGGRRAARMGRLLERIPQAERPAVLAALDVLAEAARAE